MLRIAAAVSSGTCGLVRCGVASHTARRTFVTVNILRGKNIHAVKRCTGHSDLRHLEGYVRDE